jgi:hypothetical protein
MEAQTIFELTILTQIQIAAGNYGRILVPVPTETLENVKHSKATLHPSHPVIS